MYTPLQLIQAHVRLLLSIDLDRVEEKNGVIVVSSTTVPHPYSNFAFQSAGEVFTTEQIAVAAALLQSHQQPLTLWQTEEMDVPVGWKKISREAWMICRACSKPDLPSGVSVQDVEIPLSEMGIVFDNAYSGQRQPGEIGYHNLPAEYLQVYLEGRVRPPVVMRNFGLWVDGVCVAIAMVALDGDIAGLYSVATHRQHRRQGYGKIIAGTATSWAFEHGATSLFLQTEADSALETLYNSIGYQRSFVALFLQLEK